MLFLLVAYRFLNISRPPIAIAATAPIITVAMYNVVVDSSGLNGVEGVGDGNAFGEGDGETVGVGAGDDVGLGEGVGVGEGASLLTYTFILFSSEVTG